ncbi:hypothetical protein Tco_0991115 [Tanacetum coccineum]|uniref:Uncharacterized protein n=1 Tax=Tanacetum coccineum TaxID=301880 RepID=A0ABQ5EYB8_9ASTR
MQRWNVARALHNSKGILFDGALRYKLVLFIPYYVHPSFLWNDLNGDDPWTIGDRIDQPSIKEFDDFLFYNFLDILVHPPLGMNSRLALNIVDEITIGEMSWSFLGEIAYSRCPLGRAHCSSRFGGYAYRRKGRLIWICLKIDRSRSSSSSLFCFFNRDEKGISDDLEGWYKVGDCGTPSFEFMGVSSPSGLSSSVVSWVVE